MTTASFTFVTVPASNFGHPASHAVAPDAVETAVYKQDTPASDWVLVTVEKGDASAHSATEALIRSLGGHAYRTTTQVTHLRVGGIWQQVVSDISDTTPRQRIETEILDLRAKAVVLDEQARFSGSMSGSTLHTRADAMQHVLDTLDGINEDDD
jgi:hypothetical protein